MKSKRDTTTDFLLADAAWSAELVRSFGHDARSARYEKRGRGKDGDALSVAYQAREKARIAWEARTGERADTI